MSKLTDSWRFFFTHLVECLGSGSGGLDQINQTQLMIAYCLWHGLRFDFAQILWNDLAERIKVHKRKSHVPFIRFLSLIFKRALGNEYDFDTSHFSMAKHLRDLNNLVSKSDEVEIPVVMTESFRRETTDASPPVDSEETQGGPQFNIDTLREVENQESEQQNVVIPDSSQIDLNRIVIDQAADQTTFWDGDESSLDLSNSGQVQDLFGEAQSMEADLQNPVSTSIDLPIDIIPSETPTLTLLQSEQTVMPPPPPPPISSATPYINPLPSILIPSPQSTQNPPQSTERPPVLNIPVSSAPDYTAAQIEFPIHDRVETLISVVQRSESGPSSILVGFSSSSSTEVQGLLHKVADLEKSLLSSSQFLSDFKSAMTNSFRSELNTFSGNEQLVFDKLNELVLATNNFQESFKVVVQEMNERSSISVSNVQTAVKEAVDTSLGELKTQVQNLHRVVDRLDCRPTLDQSSVISNVSDQTALKLKNLVLKQLSTDVTDSVMIKSQEVMLPKVIDVTVQEILKDLVTEVKKSENTSLGTQEGYVSNEASRWSYFWLH
uniref:uncharacterized protein LOC122591527 n=1 Tax=Erigeron canadensis TaxID=72917 RepID=UPI001CB8FE36|nr:uncharacterized protein LOC122591527 [Erigeron canadensis]